MRRTLAAGLAVGLGMCLGGEAKAQSSYLPTGRNWLDTMVMGANTPGHSYGTTTTDTVIPQMTQSSIPRRDYARDYYASQGMSWAMGPGYSVQQNGPTTTYSYRPAYSYSAGRQLNGGTIPTLSGSPPTLLNPQLMGSNPNRYDVRVVQQRTPNIYAPYQYNVVPVPRR